MKRSNQASIKKTASDKELLQTFEPVVRYVKGEGFYPMTVETYINSSSLWTHNKNGGETLLVPEGEMTVGKLIQPYDTDFSTVQFLRFVPPLQLQDLTKVITESAIQGWNNEFRSEHNRLTRGGLVARLIDAVFSISLLLRGIVPAITATAGLVKYQELMQKKQEYHYYGRVVRDGGWTVLQYWYFYAYNSWRSGFEGVNDHESDWEMVSVYLYEDEGKLKPEWVAYASHDYHGADLRRHWQDESELTIVEGTHPVIFAGAGSHASYFRQGEYQAEISLPFPDVVRRGISLISEAGRKVLGDAGGQIEHMLRIPFVDYALGDGVAIGTGKTNQWTMSLIDEKTPFVSQYRGLWGLYAKDPISGENAPAGPMYNRDGSPRFSWYDPLGFAGLEDISTPPEQQKILKSEIKKLELAQPKLIQTIEVKARELQTLGLVLEGMKGKPHLHKKYELLWQQMTADAANLSQLRQEYSENEVILDSMRDQLRVMNGKTYTAKLQAHLTHKAEPVAESRVRFQRLTELWAMMSVSMMLLVLAAVAMFLPYYILLALGLVVIVFVAFEAMLRGTFVTTLTTVAVLLAMLSSLILVVELWRWVLIGLTIMLAFYLLVQRLRQ